MIELELQPGHGLSVGDAISIEGEDLGRIAEISTVDMGREGWKITAQLLPSIVYFAKRLAWLGQLEQRLRHFTAEPMPCHDPPVAWRARIGWDLGGRILEVIIRPETGEGIQVFDKMERIEPVILPTMPGR